MVQFYYNFYVKGVLYAFPNRKYEKRKDFCSLLDGKY